MKKQNGWALQNDVVHYYNHESVSKLFGGGGIPGSPLYESLIILMFNTHIIMIPPV